MPALRLSDNTAMHVEVVAASPEQESVLANLFELYAHDFSEISNVKIGTDGRFGYEPLPLYWQDSNRYPFLIRADSELAGFVLMQRGSQVSVAPDTWDVAEFFVLRRYRRHGIGTQVAHEVWKRFSGSWEVRVSETNAAALAFWAHAIAEFTLSPADSTRVDVRGKWWHVFSFTSAALPN